ncbi:sterol desaturase family protein, partial [Xanthovirga aplysinae]|uniref:sterol desaturase family protein n=1 Tax=Xanthovirga aplysinae TaxID=2529853 RepID=UPI0012BC21AD
YAIPFFVLAIILEIFIARKREKHHDWFEVKDTVSSLTMGIGNVIVSIPAKFIFLGVYLYLYDNFKLWDLDYSWWVWVLAFFGEDLSYYLFHSTSHFVRIFWASHVNHHSSQKYNLGTALRQEWSGVFYDFIFWMWLAVIGFPPLMILTLRGTNLLFQFWIHTEAVGRMPGWFEFIFNTPSHHRVHHSSDVKYLDKNFAGTLVIWDRIFGTFKEEEERPNYGLTKNINSYNPIVIAFHEWSDIIKDVMKHPRYAFQYLFYAPGWSHDGSRKTTKQLLKEMNTQKLSGNKELVEREEY